MSEYKDFLHSKIIVHEKTGIRVHPDELHTSSKPHQRDATLFALEQGNSLCAMKFGLGKTQVQLDWARILHGHFGGKHIIIAPIATIQEFTHNDGPRLGLAVKLIESQSDITDETDYYITNYDKVRMGKFDFAGFTSVSLDEGNVLRNLESDTTDALKLFCRDIPYKLIATATPAPNQYLELINYADFLGVMDRGLALTRFFQRDSQHAGNLQLYPGHEDAFFAWLRSWAFFLSKPSDLGYSDDGYDLPELDIRYHRVQLPRELLGELKDRDGQTKIISDGGGDLMESHRIDKMTVDLRVQKVCDILKEADTDEHAIIWHYREDERGAIQREIPWSQSIYGTMDRDERLQKVLRFGRGEIQTLSTKPEVCGTGCNWQHHCHWNIYVNATDKFDDWIQSLHRTYRFMQKKQVRIDLIYTSENEKTLQNMLRKWKEYDALQARMSADIRQYGLHQMQQIEAIKRSFIAERQAKKGKNWTYVNNDNVAEMPNIGNDRFGLAFTSIPFGNQYEYTNFINDFGHNISDDAFFRQMDFLLPEVYRTLQPGRNLVIHVKDRILYGWQNGQGMYSVGPFSDKTAAAVIKHGFVYMGRRTIVTDVVRENNQTYRLGWSEVCKDATNKGCGSPEYLLTFRKPQTNKSRSYADVPVTKSKSIYTRAQWQLDASSFWRSSGNRYATPEDISLVGMGAKKAMSWWIKHNLTEPYDYDQHVALCRELEDANQLPSSFALLPAHSDHSDVWTDVNYMNGLNVEQKRRKAQNHICPLPFDIVDRVINLYSNPGDEVCDFFGGLGTVPLRALKQGRKGFGIELNPTYWQWGTTYLEETEREMALPTLFDILK